MIHLELEDKEYVLKELTHVRNVARAVLINDKNEVCILTVDRDDIFGKCLYYETPGGGVDENETPEQAVIREIDEEIGCKAEIIIKIGVVEDYYNLIGRKNINHYYLCRTLIKTKIHHESLGDQYIKNFKFVPIDEAIELFDKTEDSKLARILKQRELPILIEAKKLLSNIFANNK